MNWKSHRVEELTGDGEEGVSADTWHSGTAETAQQELMGGGEEVEGEGNSVNTQQSHTVEGMVGRWGSGEGGKGGGR